MRRSAACSAPRALLLALALAALLLLLQPRAAAGAISAANAKLSMQQEADYLTSCASCVSTWNAWSPKDKRCYFMGPESSAHGKMLPNAKMWLDMSRKDPTVLVRDRSQCPAKKGRGEL